jgi:hypothetical protein
MKISTELNKGFKVLGFDQEKEDCLFLCENRDSINDFELGIHLEQAENFDADAVFFRRELGKYKPQIYIYDFTGKGFHENKLADIKKKSGATEVSQLLVHFMILRLKY